MEPPSPAPVTPTSLPQLVSPRPPLMASQSSTLTDEDVLCEGGDGHSGTPSRPPLPGPAMNQAMQEHRVDPALRAALEKLDSVRERQPAMDDFGLDKFIGACPRRVSSSSSITASLMRVQ